MARRIKLKLLKCLPLVVILIFVASTFFFLNIHQSSNEFLRHMLYNYHQIKFHGLPGSYLAASRRSPNGSYCNFRFGLPEELLYEDGDLTFPIGQGSKSPYRILENVIEGGSGQLLPEVTYSTHTTPDFVNYLAEITRFWEGPISVAAFVPDYDADLTIAQLKHLCSCVPEMERVSVHFVFPWDKSPYLQDHDDEPPTRSCEVPDSSKLQTFRIANELKYPINVCRNVARSTTRTRYNLVSDIQLIPSEELASNFVEMLHNVKNYATGPRVFVVPVFEVESYDVIPRTKPELKMMIEQERAIYFHRHICSHCQKFPKMKTWITRRATFKVTPFASAKREAPYHRWEPIYIGTKDEPLYNEALSWEGLQDKMAQMLEMCLMNYDFVILDGAFLVHWPGIKKRKPKSFLRNYWRTPFQKENAKQFADIIDELQVKYRDRINPKCKLQ